jgi:hypothetical protein
MKTQVETDPNKLHYSKQHLDQMSPREYMERMERNELAKLKQEYFLLLKMESRRSMRYKNSKVGLELDELERKVRELTKKLGLKPMEKTQEVNYGNVPVGAALVVKSDNSKQPENRTVVDKTGPTSNNMYCLVILTMGYCNL